MRKTISFLPIFPVRLFPAMLLSVFLCAQAPCVRANALYVGAGAYLPSAEAGYYDRGSASGSIADQPCSVDASALTVAGAVYEPIGPFIEVYGNHDRGRVDIESPVVGVGIRMDFS